MLNCCITRLITTRIAIANIIITVEKAPYLRRLSLNDSKN